MALTLNFDPRDADRLWTTWVDGGAHTGTPTNGSTVQAWQAETDGSVQPVHAAWINVAPVWRTGGASPFLLPCLDFDGTMEMRVGNGDTRFSYRTLGSYVGASASTFMFGLCLDATPSSTPLFEAVLGSGLGELTFFVRDDAGQPKLSFSGHDGAWRSAEINVALATPYIVEGRHDGANLYINVNGGTDVSTACGAISSIGGELRIGRGPDLQSNCKIGQIKIWNEFLTGSPRTTARDALMADWITGGGSALSEAEWLPMEAQTNPLTVSVWG